MVILPVVVSVVGVCFTISYLYSHLTTKTGKYVLKNSFIGSFAKLKCDQCEHRKHYMHSLYPADVGTLLLEIK